LRYHLTKRVVIGHNKSQNPLWEDVTRCTLKEKVAPARARDKPTKDPITKNGSLIGKRHLDTSCGIGISSQASAGGGPIYSAFWKTIPKIMEIKINKNMSDAITLGSAACCLSERRKNLFCLLSLCPFSLL